MRRRGMEGGESIVVVVESTAAKGIKNVHHGFKWCSMVCFVGKISFTQYYVVGKSFLHVRPVAPLDGLIVGSCDLIEIRRYSYVSDIDAIRIHVHVSSRHKSVM